MTKLIEALARNAKATEDAAVVTKRFGDALHDRMNWAVSMLVLRGMRR